MSTVKSVFKVNLGLSNEVVWPEKVPVKQLNIQDRVLGERGLYLEASKKIKFQSGSKFSILVG